MGIPGFSNSTHNPSSDHSTELTTTPTYLAIYSLPDSSPGKEAGKLLDIYKKIE